MVISLPLDSLPKPQVVLSVSRFTRLLLPSDPIPPISAFVDPFLSHMTPVVPAYLAGPRSVVLTHDKVVEAMLRFEFMFMTSSLI